MEFAYAYKAKGQLGEVSGIVYAEQSIFARAKLNRMNLQTRSLRLAPIQTIKGFFHQGFDQSELEQFYRYMSRLIEKGINLSVALSDAIDTVSDVRLKGAISIMSDTTRGSGLSLPQAMVLGGFPPRDCDLIKNVEGAGKMGQVLSSLADEIKRDMSLRRTIRKLLFMPSFMYIFIACALYSSMVLVAPKIYALFKNVLVTVQLSPMVQAYYEFCEVFNKNLIIGTAMYVAIFIGIALFLLSGYVKSMIDMFKPLRIARTKSDYAALWGSFSLLYEAGVHTENICRGLAKASQTKEARNCFTRMASFVRDGRDIDEAVALARFPLYIINPVVSARRSNSLTDGTRELSEKLIIDVELFASKSAFWIEIGVIFGMAVFVFGFAMLTIVPMMSSVFSAI